MILQQTLLVRMLSVQGLFRSLVMICSIGSAITYNGRSHIRLASNGLAVTTCNVRVGHHLYPIVV